MAKFVILSKLDSDENIYINPLLIAYLIPKIGHTLLGINGKEYRVQESVEQIQDEISNLY